MKALKFTYWYGALLDALMGFLYLYSLFVAPLHLVVPPGDGPATRLAKWITMIWMFAGTYVLFWALKKPVDRKVVLPAIATGLLLLAVIEMLIGQRALWIKGIMRITMAVIPLTVGYFSAFGSNPKPMEIARWRERHFKQKLLSVIWGLASLVSGLIVITLIYLALGDPLPVALVVDNDSANRLVWGVLVTPTVFSTIIFARGVGRPTELASALASLLPRVRPGSV